jgi:hypothetical protein
MVEPLLHVVEGRSAELVIRATIQLVNVFALGEDAEQEGQLAHFVLARPATTFATPARRVTTLRIAE